MDTLHDIFMNLHLLIEVEPRRGNFHLMPISIMQSFGEEVCDYILLFTDEYVRMGTHPSGPAKLAESDQILASWLKDKESSVGIVPEGYPANDLPYLFKVLSIRTALSIQVLI